MRHFSITDQDKKKIRLSAPTSWDEITLDQLIEIEGAEKNDVLKIFCILTGLDLVIAENSKDKELENAVWQVVEFISHPLDWDKLVIPSMFQVGKEAYKTPLKYNDLTVGQNILIAQLVKNVEDLTLKIPEVLAIIFQPIIDKGNFESKRLPEVTELMKKTNGLGAYSIGRFFFQNSKHFRKCGILDSLQYQRKKTPKVKLSPKWLKSQDLSLLENYSS